MLNNIVNFLKSKKVLAIIIVLFSLALLVGVFGLGIAVGYHKARFSYAWGENYHRNFGGPRGGFFRNFSGRDFIDAHGTFGQIVKIDLSTNLGQVATLVIKGQDNVEKIVLIKDDTSIRRFRDAIKPSDLKADDYVVVIGEPNNEGQIAAKFIRLLPASSSREPSEASRSFPSPSMQSR